MPKELADLLQLFIAGIIEGNKHCNLVNDKGKIAKLFNEYLRKTNVFSDDEIGNGILNIIQLNNN